MIRFLFTVTGIFIVTSTLALADCNPNTEVTSREISDDWGAGTVDLLEGDVSLIIALRAKLCGNLKHRDFAKTAAPFSGARDKADYRTMSVYGWSDTTDDKLVFSVRVPNNGDGKYKVNLLLHAEQDGNTFQVSAPATTTTGTLTTQGVNSLRRKLDLRDVRVPMTGTITLNEGDNEIEVKLTTIATAQKSTGMNATRDSQKGLSVLAIELIKESENDALLKRAQTFPDMRWYTEKGTWGLFAHHSACCAFPNKNGTHKSGDTYNTNTKPSSRWKQFVEDFEVVPFVDKVEEMGASYVVFTIFHGIVYFPGPSSVLDGILSGRTATRDLIKDLGNELEKRDMRLLLYYHPGKDDGAWNQASGYLEPPNTKTFSNNVIKLHTEWASRYNGTNGYPTLGSTGIYTDALWQGVVQRTFPFKRLVDAIKAPDRLPNAIIGVSNQKTTPPTIFTDIAVEDHGIRMVFPDPTIHDNQPGVMPSATMLGVAASAVVRLQPQWFYRNSFKEDWSSDSQRDQWLDEQLVALISYANGMGAPVILNSIISIDVRAGVDFISPTSIAQMKRVTNIIKNNLRPHIADNSELNRITYTGNWAHHPRTVDARRIRADSSNRANSFNFTRSETTAQDASVEFTFEGSEIRVFANQNSSGGPVEVVIDNVKKPDATTLSNTVKHQVKIFEDTSLSAGKHTIKLINKEAKQFNFDYFETQMQEQLCAAPPPPPAPPPDPVIVDDRDPGITYSGAWTEQTHGQALGKTINHTQEEGAYAEYTFTGTKILFYTRKGPTSRKMKIYIDNTLVDTNDGYAADWEHGALAYQSSNLSPGEHTIKVECAASTDRNPSAQSRTWCHVDQFSYLPTTN